MYARYVHYRYVYKCLVNVYTNASISSHKSRLVIQRSLAARDGWLYITKIYISIFRLYRRDKIFCVDQIDQNESTLLHLKLSPGAGDEISCRSVSPRPSHTYTLSQHLSRLKAITTMSVCAMTPSGVVRTKLQSRLFPQFCG